jgi:hypothetical protein
MAKYELPIYGENDEVIRMHETNICPWAVYIEAADLQERLQDKPAREQIKAVGDILKSVFVNLTDDELLRADGTDVMNTFMQIVTGGQSIHGGNAKNAPRART